MITLSNTSELNTPVTRRGNHSSRSTGSNTIKNNSDRRARFTLARYRNNSRTLKRNREILTIGRGHNRNIRHRRCLLSDLETNSRARIITTLRSNYRVITLSNTSELNTPVTRRGNHSSRSTGSNTIKNNSDRRARFTLARYRNNSRTLKRNREILTIGRGHNRNIRHRRCLLSDLETNSRARIITTLRSNYRVITLSNTSELNTPVTLRRNHSSRSTGSNTIKNNSDRRARFTLARYRNNSRTLKRNREILTIGRGHNRNIRHRRCLLSDLETNSRARIITTLRSNYRVITLSNTSELNTPVTLRRNHSSRSTGSNTIKNNSDRRARFTLARYRNNSRTLKRNREILTIGRGHNRNIRHRRCLLSDLETNSRARIITTLRSNYRVITLSNTSELNTPVTLRRNHSSRSTGSNTIKNNSDRRARFTLARYRNNSRTLKRNREILTIGRGHNRNIRHRRCLLSDLETNSRARIITTLRSNYRVITLSNTSELNTPVTRQGKPQQSEHRQ